MKFLITESRLNSVVESYINDELKVLKNWLEESLKDKDYDDIYALYDDYQESFLRSIDRTDKFDVVNIKKFPNNWIIDVVIYSDYGDFDWDLLIEDLERKIMKMFTIDDVTIRVVNWESLSNPYEA